MTRLNLTTILVASFGFAACTSDLDETPPGGDGNTPPPGSTSGGEDNTFDHQNDGPSVWEIIDRLSKEGPPRYTSKVHSCAKIRVANLGNLLRSVGVDMTQMGGASAAQLYATGFNALGAPNFENRIRENISITTSGASREFDIFAAAAPEVIANLGTLPRCAGVALFDAATNDCRADGITCLIGVPAQAAHLDYCNLTVRNASSVDTGKRVAVAAMLAAANTCE
jgi:hypothetical protein